MSGSYCIFHSQHAAQAYADQAYRDWMAAHDEAPYRDQTTSWATPAQRLTDQQWIVAACPATDNSAQTVEASDPSWWPEPSYPGGDG